MKSIYDQLGEACRQFGENAGEALKEAYDLIATNGRRERVMDRKKYIVEASDDVKKVMAMGVTRGGAIWTDTTDIENLEELNSDYINEHYGSLQDDAYQRGLEEGKKATWGLVADASGAEYQRGLDDAWEAARKIAQQWEDDTDTEHRLVIDDSIRVTLDSMTASEAIEKLKAYEEQKADDEIKVGDEVRWGMDLIVVTRLYMDGGFKWCDGISKDGIAFHVLEENVSKTNRHFNIDKILEEMKE